MDKLMNCPICNDAVTLRIWQRGFVVDCGMPAKYDGNIRCLGCNLTMASIDTDISTSADSVRASLISRWNKRQGCNRSKTCRKTLAELEEFTPEVRRGPYADVSCLTFEQAIYYIRHKCDNCKSAEVCTGELSQRCEEKVQALVNKYKDRCKEIY